MIEVYDLVVLLNKYGVDGNKLLKKNSYVIEKGYYYEIEKTLKYLISELNIEPKNIEKCPSILYLNVNAIKTNYEFLIKTNLYPSDINTCLHILSTNPNQLVETYDYVLNKYGMDAIRKITSILRVNIERIQVIEIEFSYILDTSNIISAATSRRTIEEIERIIKVCKENNVEISGSVFKQPSDEIERIIKVCKDNNIEISGSVFHKSSEEIERIIKVCKENNVEISGSVFLKPADEIERIVKVCKENNVEISGSVFFKPADEIERIVKVCKENNVEISGSVFLKPATEIEKTIKYLKEHYSSDYLKPLIVIKKVSYLEKVFSYLDSLNLLPYVVNSASILTLTLEEIIERKEFIESIGESLINSKNKFNSIFGLSKKNYQKKKEEYNLSSKMKR